MLIDFVKVSHDGVTYNDPGLLENITFLYCKILKIYRFFCKTVPSWRVFSVQSVINVAKSFDVVITKSESSDLHENLHAFHELMRK